MYLVFKDLTSNVKDSYKPSCIDLRQNL